MTGTRDADEALRKYKESHLLSDEDRRAMGLPEVDKPDSIANPGDDPND